MTPQIDPRCVWIEVEPCTLPGYRLTRLLYWDGNVPGEGNQSANIYVRAKGRDGLPALGQKAYQYWPAPDGKAEMSLRMRTSPEVEGDPLFSFAGVDFVMSGDSHRPGIHEPGPYSIALAPNSDKVIGMGVNVNRAHDVYALYFEWAENETPATILTDGQIARLVVDAKFPDPVTAMAIILAESGGNPKAQNISVPGNVDRGLWQFSSKYHGDDVPDAIAYDAVLSTKAAFEHSKSGTDFGLWVTYTSEAHKKFLARAQAAIAQPQGNYVTIDQMHEYVNAYCENYLTKQMIILFLGKWINDLGG